MNNRPFHVVIAAPQSARGLTPNLSYILAQRHPHGTFDCLFHSLCNTVNCGGSTPRSCRLKRICKLELRYAADQFRIGLERTTPPFPRHLGLIRWGRIICFSDPGVTDCLSVWSWPVFEPTAPCSTTVPRGNTVARYKQREKMQSR